MINALKMANTNRRGKRDPVKQSRKWIRSDLAAMQFHTTIARIKLLGDRPKQSRLLTIAAKCCEIILEEESFHYNKPRIKLWAPESLSSKKENREHCFRLMQLVIYLWRGVTKTKKYSIVLLQSPLRKAYGCNSFLSWKHFRRLLLRPTLVLQSCNVAA